MPLYAFNKLKYPGSIEPPIPIPLDVYDGDGKKIEGWIEAFDSETGLCVMQQRDSMGKIVFDEQKGETVTYQIKRKPPLTMVPCNCHNPIPNNPTLLNGGKS